jgi:hypothetical protein
MNLIYRSFIYDFLYTTADFMLKKYPVCNIRKVNGKMCCNSTSFYNTAHLCCVQCQYKSENGCIIKCLSCKLQFCYVGFGTKRGTPYFGRLNFEDIKPRSKIGPEYIPYINNYRHINPILQIMWGIGRKYSLLTLHKPKQHTIRVLRDYKYGQKGLKIQ